MFGFFFLSLREWWPGGVFGFFFLSLRERWPGSVFGFFFLSLRERWPGSMLPGRRGSPAPASVFALLPSLGFFFLAFALLSPLFSLGFFFLSLRERWPGSMLPGRRGSPAPASVFALLPSLGFFFLAFALLSPLFSLGFFFLSLRERWPGSMLPGRRGSPAPATADGGAPPAPVREGGQMRVIAGIARGRRLVGPKGNTTRPLTDRAKEALFSTLGSVVGDADVLDLYAGSGSLGLEALSRGAASAVFVERDRRALEALTANVDAVGCGGTIHRDTVERFLARTTDTFDLVFVDPPYAETEDQVGAVLDLLLPAVRDGGTIVVHRRFGGPQPAAPTRMHVVDRRRYGDAELWRFDKEDPVITALVPGSFDPPTKGHIDVIERCAGIFERVLVAVVANPSKDPLFTAEERMTMLRDSLPGHDNVDVDAFSGLLVDFASERGASVIVKGLRAMTDFDYEIQMSQMNRHLSGIVTLFVATKPEFGYLSSSLVKQVAGLGGDVDNLVPANVNIALKERFGS